MIHNRFPEHMCPDRWDAYDHRKAPECDDQLPVYSRVGRGIKGDAFKVTISDPDEIDETYLEGWYYDEAAKEWCSEPVWVSENINGGHLSMYYNVRPFSIPQCFTMTFVYSRPGRPEWSWTSPAIPYVWDVDGDGQPDVDDVVGCGVATLYLKANDSDPWTEMLIYPDGTGPEDFNTPEPNEAWTVNLDFGANGSIKLPNFDDLAKIFGGMTAAELIAFLRGSGLPFPNWELDDGSDVDNVKDYIDGQDDIIKGLIDDLESSVEDIETEIDSIQADITKLQNSVQAIVSKIFGGGTINSDGTITWPNTNKIPVADLNIFAGTSNPTDSTYANALRSRTAVSTNDIKAV